MVVLAVVLAVVVAGGIVLGQIRARQAREHPCGNQPVYRTPLIDDEAALWKGRDGRVCSGPPKTAPASRGP
jgi:hypothetical protein